MDEINRWEAKANRLPKEQAAPIFTFTLNVLTYERGVGIGFLFFKILFKSYTIFLC